jgi:chromosome segregation ATPase
MSNTSETQLAIQKHLEQQLYDLYQLQKEVHSAKNQAANTLESLEQSLIEEVRQRSLILTRHLAKNEHYTKELIRLELEQEQIQQSSSSQQQELSALQRTVTNAKREQQKLTEEKNRLQQEVHDLHTQQHVLLEQKSALESDLTEQKQQCDALQEEVDALQRKAKHLQQNIDGLLQMRENDMLSVMDLTARLSDVSSGKE